MKKSLKKEKECLKKDFDIVVKCLLKDEPKKKVQKWLMSKELELDVSDSKNNRNDGDCYLYFDKKKKKSIKIAMTKKVMNTKFICWRMSILIHEIGYFLQFMEGSVTKDNLIPEHEHHGGAWANILKESVSRSKLKISAFAERSSKAKCLFSKHCKWCSTKSSRMSVDVEKLYESAKVSKFGRICKHCEAPDAIRLLPHIQNSEHCLEQYKLEYGDNWQSVVQPNHAILQRRNKRPITNKSVCVYCPNTKDCFLLNHLEYNPVCAEKYIEENNVNTLEGLQSVLLKKRKRKNKQESRARNRQK